MRDASFFLPRVGQKNRELVCGAPSKAEAEGGASSAHFAVARGRHQIVFTSCFTDGSITPLAFRTLLVGRLPFVNVAFLVENVRPPVVFDVLVSVLSIQVSPARLPANGPSVRAYKPKKQFQKTMIGRGA